MDLCSIVKEVRALLVVGIIVGLLVVGIIVGLLVVLRVDVDPWSCSWLLVCVCVCVCVCVIFLITRN